MLGHPLRARTGVLAAITAALVAVLATGCGSDKAPTTPGGDNTSAPTGSSTDGAQTPGTTDDDGDDADIDLPKGPPVKPAKVTYKSDDGETITMAWDGDKFAMIMEDGHLISDGKQMIMCSEAGGQGGCFSLGGEEDAEDNPLAAAFGSAFGLIDILKDSDVAKNFKISGNENIIGRSATCATAKDATIMGEAVSDAEICYDNETGAMLKLLSTDADGTKSGIEATAFAKPSADDFKPTGPVQDLSDLLNSKS